jgi:hypothetical protein
MWMPFLISYHRGSYGIVCWLQQITRTLCDGKDDTNEKLNFYMKIYHKGISPVYHCLQPASSWFIITGAQIHLCEYQMSTFHLYHWMHTETSVTTQTDWEASETPMAHRHLKPWQYYSDSYIFPLHTSWIPHALTILLCLILSEQKTGGPLPSPSHSITTKIPAQHHLQMWPLW